jgi:hypothetical protein
LGADVTEPFASEVLFRYPLLPFVQGFAGWHSHSRTSPERDTGGYGAEVRYRRTFGGRGLIPKIGSGSPEEGPPSGKK